MFETIILELLTWLNGSNGWMLIVFLGLLGSVKDAFSTVGSVAASPFSWLSGGGSGGGGGGGDTGVSTTEAESHQSGSFETFQDSIQRQRLIDEFGLSQLLGEELQQINALDEGRRQFLTDLMLEGSPAFQGRTDAAINQALSGPGMTGTGDAARSRATGFAATQAAQEDMDQRLQAATLLGASPSATGQFSRSLLPLMPTEQTIQDHSRGTSEGSGIQSSHSVFPIIHPSSGGGCCVIASVANGNRYAYPVQVCRDYRNRYMTEREQLGYYRVAEVLVPLMLRFNCFMSFMRWWVGHLVRDLEHRLGRKGPAKLFTRLLSKTAFAVWGFVGQFTRPSYRRSNGETIQQSIKRHTTNLAKVVRRSAVN